MEMVGLKSRSPRSVRKITAARALETPPFIQQQSSRVVRWTRTRIRAVLPFLCVLVTVSLLHSLLENSIMSSVDLTTSSDKKLHTNNISPSVRDKTVTPAPSLAPTRRHAASSNATIPAFPNLSSPETPLLTNQSRAFVDRWCDLRNTEWYVDQRTPRFLIPGAKYTGTRELAQWLMSIAPTNILPPRRTLELSFFLDGPFSKYVYKNSEKTAVYAARQRLSALFNNNNNNNKDGMTFDASPGYLFYSSLVPRRILCVIPWVKLIVLLQDPMDRLYQQYQAAVQKHHWKGTMEEWVQRDWEHLQNTGLFEPGIKRIDQDMAWYRYAHETVGEGGGVGRSLYYLQLRHWFQAMQAAGKNPADDVLIVWTEEWRKDPPREWERIRMFLGLAHSSESIPAPKLSTSKSDFSQLSDSTKEKVEKLFETSNTSLRRLLRQYGVDMGRDSSL